VLTGVATGGLSEVARGINKNKDAIFGSGTSGSSSSSSKNTSTSAASGTDTYNPLDASAVNTLKNIASQQSGIAGDLTDTLTPYLESLYGSLQDQIGGATDVSNAFYQSALEGVDPTERANQAEGDVVNAFSKGQEAWKRDLGQYGINAGNMKSDLLNQAIEQSKAIAGARSSATNTAKDESYNKLLNAMGVASNTALNPSNATNLASVINSLLSGATSATTPGLTTGSTSSLRNTTTTGKTKTSGTDASTSTPSWWDIAQKITGTAGSVVSGLPKTGA
jgi:hypothetical protein